MHAASSPARPAPTDPSLGKALIEGLNLPLSALRASLESLARDLDSGDPRTRTVAGALAEVGRVGRTVRDLADYSEPPTLRPLRCTAEEIVYSARHRLPRGLRDRVLVARMEPRIELDVDGPLLAQALTRLVENALEAASGRILVNVKSEGDAIVFTTVNHRSRGGIDWEWAQTPFQTDKPDHLGLGLTIARRDIALLGGVLELSCTPLGETIARVRMPRTGGAA